MTDDELTDRQLESIELRSRIRELVEALAAAEEALRQIASPLQHQHLNSSRPCAICIAKKALEDGVKPLGTCQNWDHDSWPQEWHEENPTCIGWTRQDRMLGAGHPCHYEGTLMIAGRAEARVLCGLPSGHDGPHVPETLRWEDE